MILIIEGPDLSGKSTAIEKISKHFKTGFLLKNLYKPDTKEDDVVIVQYWRMMNMALSFKDSLFIFDRFYQSQQVYSVLRGGGEMGRNELLEIEEFLIPHDVYYVQLSCPFTELSERYKKRGDEHVSLQQLKKIWRRYDDCYDLCKLKKIKIDTRKEGWIKDIEKLTGLKKHARNN